MTSSILVTKLFIPPTRPELVSRPVLLSRLNEGRGGKLTLISAPAGFGKTTLVSEWVGSLRLGAEKGDHPPYRIAWLSLDENDNDTTRFLTYFIAALNHSEGTGATFGKGALSMLQPPQPPPTETTLISLINEIAGLPDKIILVLDDYHLVEAQPVHDTLSFLLENSPPQLHLVIATREDPLLPLSRLRARGQLTELRATDLRFTTTEAAEFLNQAMGLDLSREDIAALEARTEGWIAGLQLAAISLKGKEDRTRLIQSFSGSHRLVLDYLIEEALNQQTASIQTFLLQTSILNRLTGSLCDAVRFGLAETPNSSPKTASSEGTAITGQNNGRAILESLDRANLFIVPLDEDRRWYRYHHLFTDLLRQRLRQTVPEQIPTLHVRASEWYEQNGFIDEAIDHALRARDFERSAHLIRLHVDALWQRGEHNKLHRWLVKLPAELIFSKPHLCIYHAWYLFASGQPDESARILQACEHAIDSSTDRASEADLPERDSLTDSERMQLRGRASAIKAFMDSYRGDVLGLIQHARLALEYLPEQDFAWRGITAIVLGDAQGFRGDMPAAYEARFEALQICQATGESYYAMLASMKVAITLREQGQLQRTIEICRQQVQYARECGLTHTGLVGLLFLIESEVLAEINDLDGAARQAKKGVDLVERAVDLTFLGWGAICLARIHFSRGELAEAEELIRKMENKDRESSVPPWIMTQMVAWQARIWLGEDKLDAASKWVEERGLDTGGVFKTPHEFDYFSLLDYILLVRVLMAQGRLDEAEGLLQRLLEAAQAGGRTSSVIEIMIIQALAHQAQGDTNQAITTLGKTLALAEPNGFIRIFVDEGPPMAHLLYETLSRGIAQGYVRQLLAAFPNAKSEQADPSATQAANVELIEPLSKRELEVLQLIDEGLTNREIAARLYLSLNTVKVHTRNIYGKLGVHSRTQAIARSQELGLLQRK